MKRYDQVLEKQVRDEAADAFIADLIKVYKKHGMSLGHEDEHGAFLIEDYEEHNVQWLKEAMLSKNYRQPF